MPNPQAVTENSRRHTNGMNHYTHRPENIRGCKSLCLDCQLCLCPRQPDSLDAITVSMAGDYGRGTDWQTIAQGVEGIAAPVPSREELHLCAVSVLAVVTVDSRARGVRDGEGDGDGGAVAAAACSWWAW